MSDPSPKKMHSDPLAVAKGDNWFLRLVKWWQFFDHQPTSALVRSTVIALASLALPSISLGLATLGRTWSGFQWIAVGVVCLIVTLRTWFVAIKVTSPTPDYFSSFVLTFASIAEIIAVFAVIYHQHASGFSGPEGDAKFTLARSLYFSTITWTTVGYGDWTPPPSAQGFVCVQALLGYMFMGLMIGLFTTALQTAAARNRNLAC